MEQESQVRSPRWVRQEGWGSGETAECITLLSPGACPMRDPTSLSVSLVDPSYPISLLPQRTILMGSHGHLYFNVFHHLCLCLCAGFFMYTMATSCGLHGVSSWFWQHSASQMWLCIHLTLTLDCRTASCGAAAHLAVPSLVWAPPLGALTMGSGLAWDVLSYRPV